jgi:ribonuclease BN (tRNA processing enzyme)
MRLRFLGAHNCESVTTRYMSLLVDGVLALDAGGLTSALTFEEQTALKGLLLTHQHYDHVRDIPALGMNLFLLERRLTLYASAETREAVETHLLDGKLYPDFLSRPEAAPTLAFETLTPGQDLDVVGYRVTPFAVPHSVPALGYLVAAPDGGSLLYTGDCGPGLRDVWAQAAPDLLVIEVTASDRFGFIGDQRRHLTPAWLKAELLSFKEIRGYLPRVVAVHISPLIEAEIVAELAAVAAEIGTVITPAYEGLEITV